MSYSRWARWVLPKIIAGWFRIEPSRFDEILFIMFESNKPAGGFAENYSDEGQTSYGAYLAVFAIFAGAGSR
jgi:hypothetical protein